MSDETLLVNDITRFGLRRLHVVRMGAPVEGWNWVTKVPADGLELVKAFETREEGVDVFHLWIVWNAREPVKVEGKTVLFWWIGKGISLRDAARYAAVSYLGWFERWPGVVKVCKLPTGSTGEIEIAQEADFIRVRLVEASWAPKGFLILEGE
jgi:hypothetical protein